MNFFSLKVNGELIIEDLNALEITLENLNGEQFDSLMPDLIRKDSTRLLSAVKVVGTLNTSALQADHVNGVPVKDIMVGSGNVELIGDLTIVDEITVTGNVTVTGKVNGMELNRQLVTANNAIGK